ncbi:hypothetical protein O1611_g9819 [Lasiodiplodia mahajangana]|uniref:Uncharacterized protein n=1 Tax=Lasiodiplodia mahajangana TaxID=1108764 RepID=A0ACC2J5C0_9PEZI|nr:hypothetical protein O1611_g9819 [Lasiodiplodia mahajangana]
MPGESVIAGSKLSHDTSKSTSNLHELRLVQAAVPESEWGNIKLTMITPAWFHMRYAQGRAYTKEAYANDAEYFADVAKVYQAELDMLYKAGLRNVQFDDPGMAYFCSSKFRDGWAADKNNIGTVEDLLDAYIALYNDWSVRYHRPEVIPESQLAHLLPRVRHRAGGRFEPLKFLPKGKNVVVGVISTKLRALEDKEAMKQRLYKAAEYVAEGRGESKEEALKSICVSPQCGFSTHETGYPLSLDDEKKKLALVRQIADEIWGEP